MTSVQFIAVMSNKTYEVTNILAMAVRNLGGEPKAIALITFSKPERIILLAQFLNQNSFLPDESEEMI